jgi:hypothetical protein
METHGKTKPIYIPAALHTRLKVAAYSRERKLNQEAEMAIEKYLKAIEKKTA